MIAEQQNWKRTTLLNNSYFQRKRVGRISKCKTQIKEQMSGFEQKISVLEQKIMDVGGVELKVQSSKVDSIKQQISIIHEKTSGDRMTVKN